VSYVALLRGVNVGGKNRLPMKDLASIFEEAGCSDVRTYIQSGNVFFEARPTTAERLPALVSDLIVERFGFRAPVILRTVGELERILRENPLAARHVRRSRPGDLPVLSERPRADEAHQPVLRHAARNREHDPQLAHRVEARRTGGAVAFPGASGVLGRFPYKTGPRVIEERRYSLSHSPGLPASNFPPITSTSRRSNRPRRPVWNRLVARASLRSRFARRLGRPRSGS
jgi:uncharacterized protein (DUF1697 family)